MKATPPQYRRTTEDSAEVQRAREKMTDLTCNGSSGHRTWPRGPQRRENVDFLLHHRIFPWHNPTAPLRHNPSSKRPQILQSLGRLGWGISQARFQSFQSTIMACFFAITTPIGIGIGIGISSIYNANSPRSLIIEGILDSISAGILVYMALVDLTAADFLSKRILCQRSM
ncbi:hypothetical protein ACS0TY_026308 [Phlomoides rotata]